ncbi:MAG: hypothetical protein WDM80_09905 [Limisphaerales bacterium]
MSQMSGRRRAGHPENRVPTAIRVGHGFHRQRIGHPMAIDDQAVFICAGRQFSFFPPVAGARGMQRLGFGLPMVECPGEANALRRRMREFKANRYHLHIRSVVVVVIVFHGGAFGFGFELFAEHFGDDENNQGSEKTAATEEINQRIAGGGKHGVDYQCDHKLG